MEERETRRNDMYMKSPPGRGKGWVYLKQKTKPVETVCIKVSAVLRINTLKQA
jgi:hypothetical protein